MVKTRTVTPEEILLDMLKAFPDEKQRASILQMYIAKNGPVGKEVGDKIKELFRGGNDDDRRRT